jgi:hypothetical protein
MGCKTPEALRTVAIFMAKAVRKKNDCTPYKSVNIHSTLFQYLTQTAPLKKGTLPLYRMQNARGVTHRGNLHGKSGAQEKRFAHPIKASISTQLCSNI